LAENCLAVCLDEKISLNVAEEIADIFSNSDNNEMQVVFLDNGFDDIAKTNAMQVLKQAGIDEKNITTI
jgi:adenine-specific DNA-methyltransferase